MSGAGAAGARDLVVRGGRLVDPAAGLDEERDLLLRGGRVAAVERPGALDALAGATFIEAAGCVVAPGLIDLHVHLREPGQTWKETIATGTLAAAQGGFTTVVAMPNTLPVNDTPDRLAWMLAPERAAAVRVLAMPAVTQGSLGVELTDFDALARAGAVGFTDDGKPVLEEAVMREALLRAGRLSLPISQHAEDTRISNSSGVNAGAMAFRLGLRGMTTEAEVRLVERDLRLLREIARRDRVRAHLHVQHVSTARAIEGIRMAKDEGLWVTCEATPHHFTLTETAVQEYDTHAKMNPPLRSAGDREAVLMGLEDGVVDCIATDHAPHAPFEKEVEFERAPNGIVGLETALGLAVKHLCCDRGFTFLQIVTLMATNPAAILGRTDLGTLRVGSAADVVVFDASASWTFRAAASRSRSRNTPFEGAEMCGRVLATIAGGQVVFRSEGST